MPLKIHYLISLLLSLSVGVPQARAADIRDAVIKSAVAQRLWRDPQWLKLLHFQAASSRSEVHSPEFFVSPKGAIDPAEEMEATLWAYFQRADSNPNHHARCQFPARYLWLQKRLRLPGYGSIESTCTQLNQWAHLEKMRSVSVLLVSGYFGNPASAFGHSLLKFNFGEPGNGRELIDLSVNFGAVVPDNELTAVYIYRGLTGGYEAGFSDSQYYTQDLVYARTEFRDMWDYELALSDYEQKLLVFHVWEIAGKKFTYYFLSKNCAYRIAELLELATNERLIEHAVAWYAPVELFHRLHALDAGRAASLIKQVRFIPSSRRTLYAQFGELSQQELDVAYQVIKRGSAVSNLLSDFPTERQARLLDALLAYYDYRITAAEGDDAKLDLRNRRNFLLRARLRLPPQGGETSKASVDLPSPGMNAGPMLGAAGFGQNGAGQGYLQLRWAAFSHELIGLNSLENGELTFLDLSAKLDHQEQVFLHRIDLLRVRKLNTEREPLPGDSVLSWNVQVGAERFQSGHEDRTIAFGQFGMGRARSVRGDFIVYGEVNGIARTGPAALAVDPCVGLITESGPWKTWVRGGASWEFAAREWARHVEADTRYRLTRSDALRVEVRSGSEESLLLSFSRNW